MVFLSIGLLFGDATLLQIDPSRSVLVVVVQHLVFTT